MSISPKALTRVTAATAAFVAALGLVGASTPAAAATSNAAPQAAAAFPDDSFRIRNPSQQAKCVTPRTPSYIGPLTIQPCGGTSQFFSAITFDGHTELIPLYSNTAGGTLKCLSANSANEVYTVLCDGASNRHWLLVGRTVRNRATGKCLSANSANAVYTANCDGAINRNWEFPTSTLPADAEAAQAAGEARRAALAGAAR